MKPKEENPDSFVLDSMVVAPYCLVDDIASNDTSQSESLSPPTGDVSVVKEDSMDSMDYPFLTGRPWPMTSAEGVQYDRTQSSHAMSNTMMPTNGWDDFLQWAPNQNQEMGIAHAAGVSEGQPMYTRRAGTMGEQTSLALDTDNIAATMPTSGATPFTFGHAMSHTPAFGFISPGSMISPSGPHGLPMNTQNANASRSPNGSAGASISSPFEHDGHLPAAMRPPASAGSLHQSPNSHHTRIGTSESMPSSPDDLPRPPNLKKRKSDESDDMQRDAKGGPPKKTAHNMIEKRYRTNLNDKIAALRDSVPSLRVMSKGSINDEDDDGEDLEGLAPAHKLNKATVLSKATEYIRHLEKRNKKLQDELTGLKKQMDSYEKMSMNAFAYPRSVGTPDGVTPYDHNPFEHASPSATRNPAQGMIPIPEDLRRMRQSSIMQPAYGSPAPPYPAYSMAPSRQATQGTQGPQGPPMVNGRGSTFMNKLMVGSLAGLMIFEGFAEREKSGEEPEGRGLFALPISLFSSIARYLWPQSLLFGTSPHEALAFFKFCLIFGALGYIVAPLLEIKPRPKAKKAAATEALTPMESIAHPIEYRREAWLTAIRTVWVPQHQFFLEAAALLLKTLKLSTRKLIGWQGYALIWNVTKEQEEARVKAWDIALDAQLTGGDAEISMSRLVLTLLASGTLPDTPNRLMLKALHIRVLLWEVAKAGYGTWYMFDELSMKLARRYWNQARLEQKLNTNSPSQRDAQNTKQDLPPHLQALLELDCDQVLVKPIIQRAYNLAWNRPSSENTRPDASTDGVVEDFAISSPLDALAAWFSSLVINNVLEHSLLLNQTPALLKDLETAIAIAPPTSTTQARALAAKAILVKKDRLQLIDAAYKALPQPQRCRSSSKPDSPPRLQPLLIVPRGIPTDIPVALVLAKCLALVESQDQSESSEVHDRAVNFLLTYRPTESSFTILSFAAAYRVLDHFVVDPVLHRETCLVLERMANAMRIWIGRDAATGVSSKIRTRVVERCIVAAKMLSGVLVGDSDVDEESDAGYGSLEEEGVAVAEKR